MKQQVSVSSDDVRRACEHLGCKTTTFFGRAYRAHIGPDGPYNERLVHRHFGLFENFDQVPDYVANYYQSSEISEKLEGARMAA